MNKEESGGGGGWGLAGSPLLLDSGWGVCQRGGSRPALDHLALQNLAYILVSAEENKWACFGAVGARDNKVLSPTVVCLRSKSAHYTREKNRLHYARLKQASFPPLTDRVALKTVFTVDGGTREARM